MFDIYNRLRHLAVGVALIVHWLGESMGRLEGFSKHSANQSVLVGPGGPFSFDVQSMSDGGRRKKFAPPEEEWATLSAGSTIYG